MMRLQDMACGRARRARRRVATQLEILEDRQLLADGITPSGGAPITSTSLALTNVVVASFTISDPTGSPGSKWAAEVMWGDGSAPDRKAAPVMGTGGTWQFIGSHTYPHTGNFTITVMIAVPGSHKPNDNVVQTQVSINTPPPPPPAKPVPVVLPYKTDFEGTGKNDITLLRVLNAQWLGIKSTSGVINQQIGQVGDVPIPGDFDADGKTDFAVFRPSTATWTIKFSSNGAQSSFQFGLPGDVPVPASYDGGRKTEPALYRPSTGQWIIARNTGIQTLSFGIPNLDEPVPADYDGDGKADLAVYRPSTGTWIVIRSAGGVTQVNFGIPGVDEPIPADYDGDHKADFAIFRPTNGNWIIAFSGGGSRTVPFGVPGIDLPVPNDYDGDGKTDIGIYRATTGHWLLIESTAGLKDIAFGAPGRDLPVVTLGTVAFLGNFHTSSIASARGAGAVDPSLIVPLVDAQNTSTHHVRDLALQALADPFAPH